MLRILTHDLQKMEGWRGKRSGRWDKQVTPSHSAVLFFTKLQKQRSQRANPFPPTVEVSKVTAADLQWSWGHSALLTNQVPLLQVLPKDRIKEEGVKNTTQWKARVYGFQQTKLLWTISFYPSFRLLCFPRSPGRVHNIKRTGQESWGQWLFSGESWPFFYCGSKPKH